MSNRLALTVPVHESFDYNCCARNRRCLQDGTTRRAAIAMCTLYNVSATTFTQRCLGLNFQCTSMDPIAVLWRFRAD